jgi:hypothetical protein
MQPRFIHMRRILKPLILLSLIALATTFEIRTRIARRAISSAVPPSQQIIARLGSESSLMDFRALPLDEVFRLISTTSGIPIEVDWGPIEAAGLPRTTRIIADMSGAPWGAVLNQVLTNSGRIANVRLTYSIASGSLMIPAENDPQLLVREYPIDPILLDARRQQRALWTQWSQTPTASRVKPLLAGHPTFIPAEHPLRGRFDGRMGTTATEPQAIYWIADRIVVVAPQGIHDQIPKALREARSQYAAKPANANKAPDPNEPYRWQLPSYDPTN